MDPKKDLEEFRRTCGTCEMTQIPFDSDLQLEPEDTEVDSDPATKEIIIRDLDHCKYKVDISVKPVVDSENSANSYEGQPVIVNLHKDHDQSNDLNYDSGEFCKERDMPDVQGGKVYDFVMSKDRTLPLKWTREDWKRLNRKWFCVGSLALSTLLLIIIVVVVLLITSAKEAKDE